MSRLAAWLLWGASCKQYRLHLSKLPATGAIEPLRWQIAKSISSSCHVWRTMEELTLWGIQGRGLAKSRQPTLGVLIARPLDRAVQVTALATIAMMSCPSAIQICTLPDIGEIGAHRVPIHLRPRPDPFQTNPHSPAPELCYVWKP